MVDQILDSGDRIKEIVSHLLDITRARFGSGLPVLRAPMDMEFVARQLVDEMRAQYPNREFVLEVSGKTEGNWDKARLGQVFSNLLGNAVQYSFKDTSIFVTLKGTPKDVVLVVHNQGLPIPPDKIGRIFDSLMRVTEESKELNTQETTNLGLGLYITNEIVTAHGGRLTVESSEIEGTTFTAHFPRKADSPHEEEKPDVPVSSLSAYRTKQSAPASGLTPLR
jgi:signal transduction histidine kinase